VQPLGREPHSNQAQALIKKGSGDDEFDHEFLVFIKSPTMAERSLRRAATAPVAGRLIMTPPAATHTPNHSRANRAFGIHRRHMDHMISEVRNRHLSAPNLSTTTDHQSSTGSEETLTPTSSDSREEAQGTISFDRTADLLDWRLI
jgi:hypothetical protein